MIMFLNKKLTILMSIFDVYSKKCDSSELSTSVVTSHSSSVTTK